MRRESRLGYLIQDFSRILACIPRINNTVRRELVNSLARHSLYELSVEVTDNIIAGS
jgi:hypothetical protein